MKLSRRLPVMFFISFLFFLTFGYVSSTAEDTDIPIEGDPRSLAINPNTDQAVVGSVKPSGITPIAGAVNGRGHRVWSGMRGRTRGLSKLKGGGGKDDFLTIQRLLILTSCRGPTSFWFSMKLKRKKALISKKNKHDMAGKRIFKMGLLTR